MEYMEDEMHLLLVTTLIYIALTRTVNTLLANQ